MPKHRCTLKKNGRTIASESADGNSDAVARNAALAKANSKIDWDKRDELSLSCDEV